MNAHHVFYFLSNLFFSSPSLNLKTPFVDAKTEKRGLQRRVSNRRKISEEEFGAAVDKRQMGGEHCDQNTLLHSFNGPQFFQRFLSEATIQPYGIKHRKSNRNV